jgi:membrane protease subunit HflC
MRNAILVFLLIVIGAAAFVAYNSYFIVHQTQTAVVLEFGNPKRVIDKEGPGLYLKVPFIQTVEYFDKRILDIDLPSKEVIASDQKRLVIDTFARYHIINPLLFLQSVTNELGARSRLESVIDSAMRSILGSSTFLDVVRIKREALMRAITERVDAEARSLGIEVVDVRLKRADLPEANSQAIYERMKTERQREAAEIRAQGVEASKRIKATADRQVTVTLAEANRDSERTRGEGDAERNRIYAEAFGKDQDFFAFYRSMQAYEEGLKSNDTRLVISPSSEFFQYFNDPRGAPRPPEQKAPGTPGSAPSPTSSQAAR